MSEPGPSSAITAALRLKPDRARVTRLSRNVLIALGGVSAIAVFGLTFWALQAGHKGAPAQLYNASAKNPAEGLGALPHDYTGLPKNVPTLGPPLPGDLGRPILNAERASASGESVDLEQQRLAQEREAARISQIFAGSHSPQVETSTGSIGNPSAAKNTLVSASADTPAAQTQDQKVAFANAAVDRKTVNEGRLAGAPSPYILEAGSIIPAALITGIRSDLPGEITAQVTQNVYDTPTGRLLLIPQGSRLIGQYNSQVGFGQNRLQMVWSRLIFPDGRSIVLDRLSGSDSSGYSGLQDSVDNHWGALFKAAMLSTVLSIGAEAGTSNSENNLAQALRSGASNGVSQIGQQLVGRSLNVQPTLTVREGFPLTVIVEHDLLLGSHD